MKSRPCARVRGSRFYHGHIFLIDYFRLRYLMRLAGLGAIEVYTDRFSPSSIALAPIVPAMYAASRGAVTAFARKARQHRRAVAPPELTAEICVTCSRPRSCLASG